MAGSARQFLAAGLADEIQLAVAPFFIGDPGAPRFVNPAAFPDGPGRRMTLAGVQAVGDIAVLRYLPGTARIRRPGFRPHRCITLHCLKPPSLPR
jgi:riboflavin biosynthesis pyrimidine reductase